MVVLKTVMVRAMIQILHRNCIEERLNLIKQNIHLRDSLFATTNWSRAKEFWS